MTAAGSKPPALDVETAAHRIPTSGDLNQYAFGQVVALAVVLLLALPLLPLLLLVIAGIRYRDHRALAHPGR